MHYCISICVTSDLGKKASTLLSSSVEARDEQLSAACDFCILITSAVEVVPPVLYSEQ